MKYFYVDLLLTKSDFSQELMLKVKWNKKSGMRFEGEKDIAKRFKKEVEKIGIIGKGGKKYFPKDGKKFLKNLKYAFSGSYLRATDMKKGEE